jgi:glycosyltransferase involved in cell wall biosynthesis
MAMQLPVISTRFSGVPELVVDGVTGLLVEPGNVPALVEAMRGLLNDPALRHRMGQAGRQRVIQDFTIERSADAMHAIFASLAPLMVDQAMTATAVHPH